MDKRAGGAGQGGKAYHARKYAGKGGIDMRGRGMRGQRGMRGRQKNLWGIIYFSHKSSGFLEDGYDLGVMADIIE